jgi:hypothetical protein
MATDRPVASISGQEEWDWNEWQARQESRSVSRGSLDQQPDRNRERNRSEGSVHRQREIENLEAELERAEQRLQYVVDHYERLLAEKNRKLATRSQSAPADDRQSAVTQIVRYLTR